MNTRLIANVFLMIICMVLMSCMRQSTSQQRVVTSFNKQVTSLIHSPIDRLGQSRASITDTLGEPSSINTEQIKNLHNPEQTDQIHTLTYRGVIVQIYDVMVFKKEMLISVRMIENLPDILPELIGQDQYAIEEKYGAPSHSSRTASEYMVYDGEGEDSVYIEFKNQKVKEVKWNFYMD